ncbi:hypothetical protein SEA_TARGET_86 [Mycobacterium phage Target]|nr:hypothetical protein SEA_TARGET_86 [Mycobacterium phage Target]
MVSTTKQRPARFR